MFFLMIIYKAKKYSTLQGHTLESSMTTLVMMLTVPCIVIVLIKKLKVFNGVQFIDHDPIMIANSRISSLTMEIRFLLVI